MLLHILLALCFIIISYSKCLHSLFSLTINNLNTKIDHTIDKISFNNLKESVECSESTSSEIPKEKFKKIGWFGISLFQSTIQTFLSMIIHDQDILNIISKGVSFLLLGFIILSALGTMGFDTKPFLSLISVFGITIGLASKDILTNTFAGILIILTSPIKRGWIINVSGYRGKVTSINTRYVKLQSLRDKSEILVPLSLVYTSTIIIEQK